MGRVIELTIRKKIVDLRQSGKKLREIREELGVSYTGIRQICERFKKYGIEGL
ncbi:MAG: helix-turn-helix domain containing protein [Saprospiraceae bacterium]|nr:helix-turn-helix domain containing protein [Saprospiraceae bacterium]